MRLSQCHMELPIICHNDILKFRFFSRHYFVFESDDNFVKYIPILILNIRVVSSVPIDPRMLGNLLFTFELEKKTIVRNKNRHQQANT